MEKEAFLYIIKTVYSTGRVMTRVEMTIDNVDYDLGEDGSNSQLAVKTLEALGYTVHLYERED